MRASIRVPAPRSLWTSSEPSSASSAVDEPAQPGARVELDAADAVVRDLDERGPVVARDPHRRPRRLGVARDVGQRLRDDVVGDGLDVGREALAQRAFHVDGNGGAPGEARDGGREPLVGQDGRMDPAGKLAQLGRRLGETLDRLVEQARGGLGVVRELRPDHAEHEPERHEPLLRAVVEVALDLPPCRVLRGDDPCAGRLELRDPRLLGLPPAQHLLRVLALGDVEDHAVERRPAVGVDDARPRSSTQARVPSARTIRYSSAKGRSSAVAVRTSRSTSSRSSGWITLANVRHAFRTKSDAG